MKLCFLYIDQNSIVRDVVYVLPLAVSDEFQVVRYYGKPPEIGTVYKEFTYPNWQEHPRLMLRRTGAFYLRSSIPYVKLKARIVDYRLIAKYRSKPGRMDLFRDPESEVFKYCVEENRHRKTKNRSFVYYEFLVHHNKLGLFRVEVPVNDYFITMMEQVYRGCVSYFTVEVKYSRELQPFTYIWIKSKRFRKSEEQCHQDRMIVDPVYAQEHAQKLYVKLRTQPDALDPQFWVDGIFRRVKFEEATLKYIELNHKGVR